MSAAVAAAASGHPLVSRAACEIMNSGGNAFDAAAGAGFVSAVAEPALTSLGGGGFLLAVTQDGEEILFDFFSDTPGAGTAATAEEPHFFPVTVNFAGTRQDFNVGFASVAVPGTLKGLLHVHRRLGRIKLADILAPAIHAAREGVIINGQQAYFLRLLEPILTMTSTGRRIFAPGGRLLGEGDRYRNPELAGFLEELARGGDGFHTGDAARRIARDMREGGGMLTEEDLAAYQVVERRRLAFSYRGMRALTNPPPSLGGTLIRAILERLEHVEMTGHAFGAPEHILPLARILREVEEKRQEIISASPAFSRGTTHMSIRDREGNMAAMTCSNGEGSGYFIPGCGIMLNNMMGEEDLHPDGFHAAAPGTRIGSMMAPTVLAGGRIGNIVIGSGGSMRIRSAIPQVIVNIVDLGISPEKAVRLPRMHWDGRAMQVEPGLPEETVSELKRKMEVNLWKVRDVYFGGVHTLAKDSGGGDPRRNGCFMTADGSGINQQPDR